uniref:Zgc:174906 n=1 Tax=Cyprinus carpio TaxID=7962 RepID=A0A8C2DFR0_CYPCA
MDGPVDGIKLIRRHKTELLEALTGDPDILLQHCHASGILSNNEYNNIKDTNMRSKQVRDILDYVIHKDNKHALNFLKLLKTQDMQETFPKLHFLQKLQINKRKTPKNTETTAKRRQERENEPLHSRMVSEKEMMMVAGCIGNSWREVGIMALGMNTTTLQQIEEDNSQHRMRVFTMLRKWSMREREQATAARLHSLLNQEENGVDTLKLNFLLENN